MLADLNGVAREWQAGRLDEHRLYVVRDEAGVRLETFTLSQPSSWDWPLLERLFSEAGHRSVSTERVDLGDGAEPAIVNVAVR